MLAHSSQTPFDTALAEVEVLMFEKDEEPPHVQHVANLALQLFDETKILHQYAGEERWMLHAASLLHDIGWSVSGSRHHKIAAQMIRDHPWKFVPREWAEQVACMVRYHRRSPPAAHHRHYMALPHEQKLRVGRMSALLRVADGLDRGHLSRVKQVKVQIESEKVHLKITGASDLETEISAARKKADLFRIVYRKELEIHTGIIQ
jgi:exopolyphosphatase / guanosine-5'-triphosphate,3'-diphosphate pyrophosphatase